jgi:Ca2+-binding RTX toxin-like protein
MGGLSENFGHCSWQTLYHFARWERKHMKTRIPSEFAQDPLARPDATARRRRRMASEVILEGAILTEVRRRSRRRRRLGSAAMLVALGGYVVAPAVSQAYTATFAGGVLDIACNSSGEAVAVSATGGKVTINGASTILGGGGDVDVSAVSQITIAGGDGSSSANDTIDLSGVSTTAGFSGLDERITVNAQRGNDSVVGSAFADSIHAGNQDDTILGGPGADNLFGAGGNDTILGGADDDRINGGHDDDSVFGQAGNDYVYSVNGIDLLDGGEDDDLLALWNVDSISTVAGGNGSDFFYCYGAASQAGATITATDSAVSYEYTANPSLNHSAVISDTSIERLQLRGTVGDDVLDGSSFSGVEFIVDVYRGNDHLITSTVPGTETRYHKSAALTDDEIFVDVTMSLAGAGDQGATLTYDSGGGPVVDIDSITGTYSGQVDLLGATGNDWFDASGYTTGGINGYGRKGDNTIIGSSQDDYFVLQEGHDSLVGGQGDDRYLVSQACNRGTLVELPGEGIDIFAGDHITDDLEVEFPLLRVVGPGKLIVGDNIERLVCGSGDDSILLKPSDTIEYEIDGEAGNDTLTYNTSGVQSPLDIPHSGLPGAGSISADNRANVIYYGMESVVLQSLSSAKRWFGFK